MGSALLEKLEVLRGEQPVIAGMYDYSCLLGAAGRSQPGLDQSREIQGGFQLHPQFLGRVARICDRQA